MNGPWCYLLYRYGEQTATPTRDDISAAVSEPYEERVPGMTEADYEEHGAALWEEWADQDDEVESCPMRDVKALSRETAVLLWQELAEGNIDLVRARFHMP